MVRVGPDSNDIPFRGKSEDILFFLIPVAGIPLTVSILATGAVCTFYTSLVRIISMLDNIRSHAELSFIFFSIRPGRKPFRATDFTTVFILMLFNFIFVLQCFPPDLSLKKQEVFSIGNAVFS